MSEDPKLYNPHIWGQLDPDAIMDLWEARDKGEEDALLRKWKIEELEGRLRQHQYERLQIEHSMDQLNAEIRELKALQP